MTLSAAATPSPLPALQIRGRSFMALIVVPEPPLADWLALLDEQLARAASYFINKPIVVNLTALRGTEPDLPALLSALEARGLRLAAVEGVAREALADTRGAHLPDLRPREATTDDDPGGRVLDIPDDPTPAPGRSLILDRAVRSGQSVMWEHGDVIVMGAIASGAEVVAAGSIHVYGALRGRAIAGMGEGGAEARIFCRKMSAELTAIDGVYETAEGWSASLNGQPVQVRLLDGKLHFAAMP